MAQTLAAVFELTDRYTANIKKIIQAQEEYEKRQERIDRATDEFNAQIAQIGSAAKTGEIGLSGLIGKVGSLISIAYLARKAVGGMISTMTGSAMQKAQRNTLQALLKDAKLGQDLYDYASEYAKTSAFGRSDLTKGVVSFATVAQNMQQMQRMIQMTERLYAKDPNQGAEGAVFAMKEILSGDVMSMRNRYNIMGFDGESIRNMMNAGDVESALNHIDEVLNRFGASQEVVEANFDNLTVQASMFGSNLKDAIDSAATPAMEKLATVIRRMNEDLQAGEYDAFIRTMVNGMRMVGNTIGWVTDNADWLVPSLASVMTALLIYNGVMKTVKSTTELLSITTGILTGNWVKAAAALAAFAGGAYIASELSKDIDAQTQKDIDQINARLNQNFHGTGEIDAHITNTDPLKVTGDVEIEQENMKYLMDIAGARFFARYSTATLAPQYIVQNQTITKDADWMEGYRVLGDMVKESAASMPGGVYDG